MKLTIDRKTWLRGEGPAKSCLYRSDGKKCCLGFFGSALGATNEEMEDKSYPSAVSAVEWPPQFRHEHYLSLVGALVKINDDKYITEQSREEFLRDKFATIDVDVEFVSDKC